MKYVLLAIVFLIIGYGASMLFSPADIGLTAVQKKVDALKTARAEVPSPATPTPTIAVAVAYPKNSFLTESDFLSIPGTPKPLGFRIGVPVDVATADSLIKALKPTLAASKSRYVTGNNKQSVVVISGSFKDRDAAVKAQRTLQPSIKNRLEIINLPPCAAKPKPDKEGFICGPPPPPKNTPAAPPAT